MASSRATYSAYTEESSMICSSSIFSLMSSYSVGMASLPNMRALFKRLIFDLEALMAATSWAACAEISASSAAASASTASAYAIFAASSASALYFLASSRALALAMIYASLAAWSASSLAWATSAAYSAASILATLTASAA